MLIGIRAHELSRVWGQISDDLQDLLLSNPNASHSYEDVCHMLVTREMQLWCDFVLNRVESFTITQITGKNEEKTCWILYACGKFNRNWLKHCEMIERWANTKGCQFTALQGRRAWAKTLKPLEYKIIESTKDFVSLKKGLKWAAAEAKAAQLQ